eukprot:m.3555 g.3555  ORF g.3555 m.3555 type:complete len:102 (+) comp9538_c0_seq1:339-644(+)
MTGKEFSLVVKSVPGKPESCNSDFPEQNREALFYWTRPADDGGFPLTNYELTASVNGLIKQTHSLNQNRLCFAFSAGRDNDKVTFFYFGKQYFRRRTCLYK